MPGSFLRPGHLCWSFWCTASLTPRTVQRSWRISPASSTAPRNRRQRVISESRRCGLTIAPGRLRRRLSHVPPERESGHTPAGGAPEKIAPTSHGLRELHGISLTPSDRQGGGSHYAESVHILEVSAVKRIRRHNATKWRI